MTPLKTPEEIAKETVAKIRKHVEVRCEEWDESMFVEKEISKLIQSERSRCKKLEREITQKLACIQILAQGDEPNIISEFPAAEDVRALKNKAYQLEAYRQELLKEVDELKRENKELRYIKDSIPNPSYSKDEVERITQGLLKEIAGLKEWVKLKDGESDGAAQIITNYQVEISNLNFNNKELLSGIKVAVGALEDLVKANEYRTQEAFYGQRPEIIRDLWDRAKEALTTLNKLVEKYK